MVGGSSGLDCVHARAHLCIWLWYYKYNCAHVCVCVCKQQDALNCLRVGWKSAVFSVCNLVQTCHQINENKCLQ